MNKHIHRFDAMLREAQAGNAKAQYRLARWLYKGRIVEKNYDAARYWSFKALCNQHKRAAALFEKISSL